MDAGGMHLYSVVPPKEHGDHRSWAKNEGVTRPSRGNMDGIAGRSTARYVRGAP